MIITNVRCDWVHVLKANKKGKFGVCAMLEENHPDLPAVEAAIEKAKAQGIAKGYYNKAATNASTFMKCLRNGTEEADSEERPEHYRGIMFFNANSATPPGLVGPDSKPMLDTSEVYSGSYFHLDVNFYPYKHPEGGKGVACGLNNVMFVRAGDRIDGRQSAEQAFAKFSDSDTEGHDDDLQ